jgi:hypothetical protein
VDLESSRSRGDKDVKVALGTTIFISLGLSCLNNDLLFVNIALP